MNNRISCNRRGFTLIELMIVLTIIGILASIAVPNYQRGIIRAREAMLAESLHTFRKAIDEFYADKGKYPDDLAGLAASGYLRGIPTDPFTGKSDSWVTIAPPPVAVSAVPGESAGAVTETGNVYDVHSGSNLVGGNGVPYNEW